MSQMFLNVVSTFKGDGLAAATRQLGAFGKSANGLSGTLGKVGAALASFGIAAKAVQFTKESIDSARDLERNLFSVGTIFDQFSPKIVQFTKDAEQLGLSQKDAAKASTFLGSVLKQSGFSMEFVTAETQKLVTLGVDLAATYGYDVQEALLGMTALFRGEYDPIEKFGVAMKQSEINSELAARGLDKLEGSARRNAEQTIRLELLYQRAADASGAFTAQSGNLYVEQKKLSAAWENMKAVVGTELLPAMGGLVEVLKPLVDELTPRLVQAVTDAQPAIQTLTQLIKDMGDKSTTTGATVSGLSDLLGYFFRLVSENFGTILKLAALLGGLRVAFLLVSAAITATPLGWLLTGLGLVAGALIVGTDAAKQYGIATNNIDYAKQKYGISSTTKTWDAYGTQLNNVKDTTNGAKTVMEDYLYQLNTIPKDVSTTVNLKFAMPKGVQLPGSKTETSWGAIVDSFVPGVIDPQGQDQGKKEGTGNVQKTYQDTLLLGKKQATAQGKLQGLKFSQGYIDGLLGSQGGLKQANQLIKKATSLPIKKQTKLVEKENKKFASTIGEVNRVAAEAAAAAASAAAEAAAAARQQAEELRRAEEARIEGLNQLYANFLDTIKGTFGQIRNAIQGAFDITGLGGSTNAILRNMDKLLTRLKSFSANVKSLATMGLDPALLQQVISAGPMAGARIASALVAGGAGALSAINAGYSQVGNLASEIATTGVQSLFDTQKQQNVYNITVTGGVGSGSTIGKAIVDAIKDYERTSGAVWQGA